MTFFKPYDWALEPKAEKLKVTVEERDGEIVLTNGSLAAALDKPTYGSTDAPEAPRRFFGPEKREGYC